MKYNVCYIEDNLPIVASYIPTLDDSDCLNSKALNYLIEYAPPSEWQEASVKDLIKKILEKENIVFSVFKSPDFYFEYNKNVVYRPEILILDWDFSIQSQTTEEYLKKFLKYSFLYIVIFTGCDKEHEIEAVLEGSDFKEIKKRVFIKSKGDDNPIEGVISEITEKLSNKFSYKYGGNLRKNAVDAMEKVLINIGESTSNNILNYFKITDDSKRDFIDFVGERFKSCFALDDCFTTSVENTDPEPNIQEIIKLWSYRLYFYPTEEDKRVQKGDVFIKEGKYFLVISANCDLARFWKKNFGFLQCIPLYSFDEKDIIKKKITLTKKANDIKDKITQSSLIGDVGGLPQGVFILPFLKENKNVDEYKNFIAFSKEISSLEIPVPENLQDDTKKKELGNEGLKYEHLSGSRRMACLAEPFLTQTVEHIMNVIRGFGVPDYPEVIKDIIKEKAKEIFE